MKSHYLIIAPHVDDDIYSCMSVIDKCLRTPGVCELTIAYAASGIKQKERLEVLKSILKENYFGYMPTFVEMELFPDGQSKLVDLNYKISIVDKLMENCDYAFLPAVSQHQDHIITNIITNAASRSRQSLERVKGIYHYEYMYNMQQVPSEMILELLPAALELKVKILKAMNEIDKILSDKSVNSERFIRAWAVTNGCLGLYEYGETFKVLFQKNTIF